MTPWFKNVIPHQDIKDGVLDESVFAADLAEVLAGNGRAVYRDAEMFFAKTYFTAGLRTICKRVVDGLNGKTDSGDRVVSLQTGFGGGKTHSLITLYHLAQQTKIITDIPEAKELLKQTGPITFESGNVAVFTNKTCDPIKGHKVNGYTIKTLWGEIAMQLGGKDAYEIIAENDQKLTCPKGIFKEVLFKCCPALILIDELADYCVSAAAVTVGKSTLSDQTISFVQELSEAVAGTKNCVLVATLPASAVEVASSELGGQVLNSLSNRLSRVSADTRPVSDEEIYEVIRRRLFESIGDEKEIDKVVTEYERLYSSLGMELPGYATKTEYRERIRKSYPFHPALVDVFHTRWASHHDFQRTRGVLRLLGAIVSDLWQRQNSLTGDVSLIHTSDVNFTNLDPLSSQLKKLYGNGYDAVIPADVSGAKSNAFDIDCNVKEYGSHNVSQGLASTILLYSFGSGSNKGISIEELKLSVIRPSGFNHNSVNGALDRIEGVAHYLYYFSAGTSSKRYWFHTKPNINILVNQAKNDIRSTEVYQEVLTRLNSRAQAVREFNVLVAPSDNVPEQKSPTLIVLHPKYQVNGVEISSTKAGKEIQKIATKKGNSARIYRNTLVFLVCSEVGFTKLQGDIVEFLACSHIRDEYKSQLEADQKDDIKNKADAANQAIESSLVNAYSTVAKNCVSKGIQTLALKQFKEQLDRQIDSNVLNTMIDEEWLLQKVGLNELKRNNLVPSTENYIKTKDVYEAFLRYDDKPMITNSSAVQDSIMRYCIDGVLAIAAGEPPSFTRIYYREDVPLFDVTDATYWLVDKSLYIPAEEGPTCGIIGEQPKGTCCVQEEVGTSGAETTTLTNKHFKKLRISGKVALENWTQIFQSFLLPLKDNKVAVNIEISAKATDATPIAENTQNYKITRESANQLGLEFSAEE
ncbi:ATP-binding protein [Prosthecochloris sp. SCSIO W1103]|uniref:ATP-binding protein n=1 Tax=Prosthecochloris sp. SCSIO W1103 TaxID=2992244 RepID=UPI00223E37FC|nr:DUF499 domain-containing protein [Prosthecochloris sp. SCSIO W1103]UZJ38779.1 DUF499 domain-containing protein [Prosthecochloris sp. SCSIO W1103]